MELAIRMSPDQHIKNGLELALGAFKNALDDPKLMTLRPHAESITSLHLDTFLQQRDIDDPSLKLTARLSPIKTVLDMAYNAAHETYGIEEATAQQLYGCLLCAIVAGHNIYQDILGIVELLDQTGLCLRSTVMGQGQMQDSKSQSACVCVISEHVIRLCTVYICQGSSAAEKRAHSMTWNLIRDAQNEFRAKQDANLLKSHQSQLRLNEIWAAELRSIKSRPPPENLITYIDDFECDDCPRSFRSQSALDQHVNSPAHVFDCDDCNRTFRSRLALDQHLNSPAHVFDCDECNRTFRSRLALDQHLNSPSHVFDCNDCKRTFRTQNALDQHLNSSAHAFDCYDCRRSFDSQNALNQHFKSRIHAGYR